ncbi:MAG: dockerin type I domain-containing protein [Phycisphaerae bacterium]
MRRYYASVLVFGLLCMPCWGQTVFMQALPGPTIDLTDPLNPSVDAGNSISLDILLDATETTAPQVVAADIMLTVTDPTAGNPGTFGCSGFVFDDTRADFLLDTCSLCAAVCGPPSVLGIVDIGGSPQDVDFLAHLGTVTFDAFADAEGDWVIGYLQNASNVVIAGTGGVIIDIINNPDAFIGVTVTVRQSVAADFAAPAFGVSFSDRAWNGYIDNRRESNNGADLNQGLDKITIEFTTAMENKNGSPISAAAFSISDTAGTPPAIMFTTTADGGKTVTLWLSDHITVQEWTTVGFNGRSAGTSEAFSGSIDIGFLPCDVNQDGRCNPLDVTRFRQYVNNIADPEFGIKNDFTDINRNGSTNPLDLTGLRQLVFGTGLATKSWAGETLPPQP